MGLSRTVSEIYGDFSRKIAQFSHTVVFGAAAEGDHPGIGYRRSESKQEAQLMLTTGSTRLAVSRGQQTWYHSTCYI